MVKFKFDVKIPKNDTARVERVVEKTVQQAIKTCALDLARTSSESTPLLSGSLSGSYAIGYKSMGARYFAMVEFAVYNKGFNYAIAMHEGTYNLGEQSKARPGGTGMSGKSYKVGKKFLTRVLEGESEAYADYIEGKVRAKLD